MKHEKKSFVGFQLLVECSSKLQFQFLEVFMQKSCQSHDIGWIWTCSTLQDVVDLMCLRVPTRSLVNIRTTNPLVFNMDRPVASVSMKCRTCTSHALNRSAIRVQKFRWFGVAFAGYWRARYRGSTVRLWFRLFTPPRLLFALL